MERLIKHTKLGRTQWQGSLADTRRVEALIRRADIWQVLGGEKKTRVITDDISSVQWLTYVVSIPPKNRSKWPFPSLVRVKLCFDFRDGTGRVEGHYQGIQKLCEYLPGMDNILRMNGYGEDIK